MLKYKMIKIDKRNKMKMKRLNINYCDLRNDWNRVKTLRFMSHCIEISMIQKVWLDLS